MCPATYRDWWIWPRNGLAVDGEDGRSTLGREATRLRAEAEEVVFLGGWDSLDEGAGRAEVVFEVGVAAVDVVDVADLGHAFGAQAGDDQAGAGADVGGAYRGAGQLLLAAYDGVVAVRTDVGAEPGQLVDEHEAPVEDVLGDERGSLADRGQPDGGR